MAANNTYPDPNAQLAANALYANQNGSPAAQQPHDMATDPDLQMQEKFAQLQQSNDMMHASAPQSHPMNAMGVTHGHFHTPDRPTHSPQQMAQTVMSLDEHGMYPDDSSSRKRSKVSRACDECRRKKVVHHVDTRA